MIQEEMRQIDRVERVPERMDPVMEVINNPAIVLTPTQTKAINDPKKVMAPNGSIVATKSVIPSPFRPGVSISPRSSMVTSFPFIKQKRTRRKTKMDKTMSRCLKEANSKLRLKNGRLRKGKTMSDVMKMAHRLCKRS
jgi:hypothetical protein